MRVSILLKSLTSRSPTRLARVAGHERRRDFERHLLQLAVVTRLAGPELAEISRAASRATCESSGDGTPAHRFSQKERRAASACGVSKRIGGRGDTGAPLPWTS
jgi:hypothetical protein